MHLKDFIRQSIETLKQAKIDNPQLDARLLAGHALKLDRAELLSQSQRELSLQEIQTIEKLVERRGQGESVARIVGKREFWGLEFGLNEATLEPRPDTETVVEAVLKQGRGSKRILDLGTGTGCLLLALLHELPGATGLGVDVNPHAVAQASTNAKELGLSARAAFRVGSWLSGITESFDVIVSNPPYIPSRDIPGLMREVREHDPLLALDGGADGLGPYRELAPILTNFLNAGGLVAFEVGQGQLAVVSDLLRRNGFSHVSAHKDLGGVERCVTGTKP
jgi:release factor glutamine methyltransferase